MVIMNPVCLLITFSALVLYLIFTGSSELLLSKFYIFLGAAMILINMLFNHRGMHVLIYLFDRPITLESFFWGLSSALMLLCIVTISAIWTKSITTSEFLFVFGRFMPKTALLVSMTCGFSALFLKRMGEIQTVLQLKGIDITKGNLKKRIGDGAQIINVLVAFSLENALISALSMKTRGYALKKRTSCLSFRMRRRDIVFIMFTGTLAGFLLLGSFLGFLAFPIFPKLALTPPSFMEAVFYFGYLLLAAAPLYRVSVYRRVHSKEAKGTCS